MAPRAWTEKDERPDDKIKQSLRRAGRSPARAREITARTANKTTSGTGSPNKLLSDRNVQELRDLAKQRGGKGAAE